MGRCAGMGVLHHRVAREKLKLVAVLPFRSEMSFALARALLLIHLLALACSPEGSPPPSDNAARASDLSPEPQVGEAYCVVAFSPDEALRPYAETAAARWRRTKAR